MKDILVLIASLATPILTVLVIAFGNSRAHGAFMETVKFLGGQVSELKEDNKGIHDTLVEHGNQISAHEALLKVWGPRGT